MEIQKRIAAIHDISGFGKCSLTVALPVLSAAGFEVSVVPTAVLSTHTAVTPGFTCRDLTDDMLPFVKHWKSIGLTFDAIYSGYLGSTKQIDIVCDIIDMFKAGETLTVVDPAMADNGKMYALFDEQFAREMQKLCKKADIIVPNMTEAAFLLGREYKEGPYTKEYIEDILKELSGLGPKKIVLTGVWFEESHLGAACYDTETDRVDFVLKKRFLGMFHGTGDVFASALTAALVKGKSLKKSTEIAVKFTTDALKRTAKGYTDHKYGVDFERSLPMLIRKLK
ncbi:MAG: pyridoxamine kinase [Ruminococcaceae bacterium]|nr:pyridoxamine kinase [Oscillospiraceae bacterium]